MSSNHYSNRTAPRPAKKYPMTEERLLNYALWYLQKQFPSKNWLERKLEQFILRKKPDSQNNENFKPMIQAVMKKLITQDIINDERLAMSLTRQWIQRGMTLTKITSKLYQKGFDKNIIAIISDFYQGEAIDEEKMADNFAKRKKLGHYRIALNKKDPQKLYQSDLAKMARAGFSFAIAKKILGG